MSRLLQLACQRAQRLQQLRAGGACALRRRAQMRRALAIHRKEEYAKSGIPMLPVTHGERVTKIHILVYTAILALISVLPSLIGKSSLFYLAAAVALGAGFLHWSVKLMRRPEPSTAMDTFRYSIVYLALLFIALVVDHYLF